MYARFAFFALGDCAYGPNVFCIAGRKHDALVDAGPCPFNSFYWNSQNYLRKMLLDTYFTGDIPEAILLLGAGTPFHSLDGLVAPRMKKGAWNDVDVQRIWRAAFVILLDEHHRKENMPRKVTPGGDEIIHLKINCPNSK